MKTATLNKPAAERVVDLERLFCRRGTVVFRMVEDSPGAFVTRGDLVAVATGVMPTGAGELTAVRVGDKVRMRAVWFIGDRARLVSGDPRQDDVEVPAAELRVVGRVIGVVRLYDETR